jgi:hypothetical protein
MKDEDAEHGHRRRVLEGLPWCLSPSNKDDALTLSEKAEVRAVTGLGAARRQWTLRSWYAPGDMPVACLDGWQNADGEAKPIA